MNVIRRTPRLTRAEFLAWAETQPARYEFDGIAPVAMTGGTRDHSVICQNIYAALRSRLRGGCMVLGPDAGVATIGEAVRFPDALVTCTRGSGTDRLIAGVVAVFEVLSPASARLDRIEKAQEYRAVPSIRYYVILEYGSVGVTVHSRTDGDAAWTTRELGGADVLTLTDLGIAIPVAELYDATDAAGR